MKRRKKILLVSGGAFAGVLLLVLTVGPAVVGSIARSRLTSVEGAAVTVGGVSFSWSGRLVIDDLRLVPDGFTEPLIDVKRVDADIGLFAAVGGTYVADVEVVSPKILIEKGEKFNYEFARRPAKDRKPRKPRAPGEKDEDVPPPLRVTVKIRDGEVKVRGRASGKIEGRLSVGETGTTGTVQLTDLEATDDKGNLFREPTLTIVHDVALAGKTIDLRKVEIASTILKGAVTGKILRGEGDPEFQGVRGAFKYIPDKLNAIARPWLPGRLEGAEEKSIDFVLDGRSSPSLLAGDLDLDLARFTRDGLTLSGKARLRLRDGRITSGTPLEVNQGRSDLEASIDLNPPERNPRSSVTFNASGVRANGQMGPILERINPIFHTHGIDAKVDGEIRSDLALQWAGPIDREEKDWIAAASRMLSGGGTFGVRNLSIAGSPAVGQILAAIGQGSILQGELVATKVRIENGRCIYDEMILRGSRKEGAALQRDRDRLEADRRELEEDRARLHPKEYEKRLEELRQREEDLPFRYTLRFSGWVGFDRKMQLRVLMPMTANMVKSMPNLQKYIGTSFWVDLHGTTDKPRLDLEKMLATAAKRAAEGILADKATDLLGGLLKNRKREGEAEKAFESARRAEREGDASRALELYKKVRNDYRDTDFFRKKKTVLEERISRLEGD